MKKFFRQLNNAVLGGLSVVIFFLLGFLWWIFDANTQVALWLVSLIIILCYLICIIIYGVCSSQTETQVYRLPMVKNIQKEDNKCILIVERNDLFNQGSYATICYQDADDSLETVLGLGYVQTINTSGFLQIEVYLLPNSGDAKKIFDSIENTSKYKKAIKVKPSLHKDILEGAQTNG